jgi:hypothetical protein
VTREARAVPILFVLVVWSLTTHGKFSDSGDEPHYLMVAESLVSDGDFDIANNYGRGDGRWFGADDLEAGPHARVTRTGSTWSTHDVGLPVLIAPIYAAATRAAVRMPDAALAAIRQTRGLFAYSLISLTLVVLTACGLSLLCAAWSTRAPPATAAAVALAIGLTPPVLSHAFLVFPETPAFLVVCAVMWLLSRPANELAARHVWLVTAAIGLMPWLHRKYSFFVFGLAFVLVQRHSRWVRAQPRARIAALAALIVVPQIALHASTVYRWGNLGGPQMLEGLPFSMTSAYRGLLGLVLDRERGLIAYAPLYLLLPACWIVAGRPYRWLGVPIALLFLPMGAFTVWSAGFSPAARYLVPLVPLLAAPVADAMSQRVMRRAAAAAATCQAVVTAVVWQYPRTLWPREVGTNDALAHIPFAGPAYAAMLPSILTGDSVLRAGLAVMVLAGLTTALVALSRARR